MEWRCADYIQRHVRVTVNFLSLKSKQLAVVKF